MIDFRSDTVTKPTKEMREAIANAVVGDDVYGDDPTINELEKLAAKMTGKEACVFVPSGTMGNQLSIMTHTKRGDEIIVGEQSHIMNHEVGATAVLSGVTLHTVEENRGVMPIAKIKSAIRSEDIHHPETTLICVENAHGSGVVLPLEYLEELRDLADKHGIKIHMDGARLFNAATALNVPAKKITQYVDSVSFCLSKGLASPIGSLVCGADSFIKKARKGRKLLGGGMRQVGILGAAGLISLKKMIKRLRIDHENALYLAGKLNKIDGFEVDFGRLDINMVFADSIFDMEDLATFLRQRNILINGYKHEQLRLVCHKDIKKEDIDYLIFHIKDYVKEVKDV